MIGIYVVKQVVDGTVRLVQVVKYSSGKVTKRLLARDGVNIERILD